MSRVRKRLYKYYDLVMALFVTILLCSNVIGAAKVCTVWGFTFGAGVLFFPISYIFNDVLTEVYGYARARKLVGRCRGACVFVSFMCCVCDAAGGAGLAGPAGLSNRVWSNTSNRLRFAHRILRRRVREFVCACEVENQ